MARKRLDQLMFERSLAESREKAKALIMEGIVYVNGEKENKAGTQIPEDSVIEVRGNPMPYVSRGGLKLEKALVSFQVDPSDRICLDCGASTGGFTDVLLQNGAKLVYAVDVGYGQLAWKLRNDPRVINLERTNARYIDRDVIPEPIEMAVIDASFISLKLLLPAVSALLAENAEIICLIKPQFEAGKEKVGKKGVVRDKETHAAVIRDILEYVPTLGLYTAGLDYSPIKGPEGNIEFLCYLRNSFVDYKPDIDTVVDRSHYEL